MNKHLGILIDRFYKELDGDFTYGTMNKTDDTLYIIFHGWDEHKKFVKMCQEYMNDENLQDYDIEKEFDCELVFDDEYSTCDDCQHVIRTSADSYSWQPDFYVGDGFIVCGDCFRDETDYQEAYLKERTNNPKVAINGLMTEEHLEDLGFKKANIESFESGWHDYRQNDNPNEIYEKLENIFYEVVFMVDGVGQFDVNFSVWVRGEI